MLKFFIVCSLVAALLIGGAVFYMKFYGKTLIESALSGMLGFEVRYHSAAVDTGKGSVNFTDVTIANRADSRNYFLKIDKLGLRVDINRLIKEKAVVIDKARLEGAALNILRARDGSFNIRLGRRSGPGGGTGVYDILKNFRDISIINSRVMFTDYRISRRPVAAMLYAVDFRFQSAGAGRDMIRAACSAKALVPSARYASGTLTVNAGLAIYRDRVNLDARIDAQFVDLAFFCPYINKYTPFIFRGGLFSSASDLRIYNGRLSSPTTVIFHGIDMNVKPYAENAQFLQLSIDKLVPYLESRGGEIVFDFYLVGRPGNITAGAGPRVRNAIGMATMAEISEIFQKLRRLR